MYPNEPLQPPPGFTASPAPNLWEHRAESGLAAALWNTLVASLSRPGDLFSGTPRAGGLGRPLAYAVILGTTGMVASSLWQIAFNALGLAVSYRCTPESESSAAAGVAASLVAPFLSGVLAPLLITAALFIGAGLTHLALMILGAGRYGFEATFRSLAYAHGPMVFYVVPFVGGLVGGVWSGVLQVIGVSKLQETEWWRALIALLLFPCACALTGIIAAVAITALVASHAGG